MKTSVRYFFALMLILSISLVSSTFAQDKNVQKYEVKIKTSAYSDMCKNRIETELKDQKGVLDAYLDLSDQIVTVTYDYNTLKSSSLLSLVENMGYEVSIIEDKASNDNKNQNSQSKLNLN